MVRCTVCGHEVPDFIWPQLVTTNRPGGHYVVVDEQPIVLRREDRPGDFESNTWHIVAEARVRFELCRDLHPELAALRDAQRGDPMREVPGTPDIIRKAARWVDQGGTLSALPEGGEDAGDPGDEGRDRGEPAHARGGGEAPGGPEGGAAGPGGG